MSTLYSRRSLLKTSLFAAAAAVAGCAPKVVKETVVVKEVVKETVQVEVEKVVKEAVEVEKEVTRVVEKVVEQQPAEQSVVEIRVHRNGAPGWLEGVHQEFEAQNPYIKVKLEAAPNAEYWTKLRTLYAGGRLGDNFWTWQENGDFDQYASSGMVASMQSYVDAEGFDTNVYFSSALRLFYVEGELSLIPEYAHPGPTGVYVNKTMCDEAGLTYVPETSAREADIYDDWTQDEFLEVIKKLTKRDGDKTTQWGYSRGTNFHQQVSMMRRFGGDAISEDGRTITCDSEESIAGIQFVADMFHVHKVWPTPDAMEDGARNLFIGGEKMASYCHGAASATQLKKLLQGKFDYVGVTIPRHSELGTRGLILSTGGNCISSLSKNPDQAWEYSKFMGSHYVGTQRTLAGGAGPGGRPDCWYDERIQAYHRVIPKFAELIPEAKPHNLPWNARASEYQDAVNQNLQKVWLGKVSAEQGCVEAAEAARKVIAKDPV